MASWHERDCRRPDVVLMDDTPTRLSWGSLFLHNDDEAQAQLRKQTAVIDEPSSLLNLNWPSSITFSSPDDVTDPDLKRMLLNLDRYVKAADRDATPKMNPPEYKTFKEWQAATKSESGHGTVADIFQDVAGPLTADAATIDCQTQASTKKLDSGTHSRHIEPDTMGPNAVYDSLMGTDEIRLLHLDAYDDMTQPLHGYLRPTRLSQRPEYVALSYTWADQNSDRALCDRIFLGNAWTPFAVTSNCAAALRRLQSRGGTRVVWIDAICIDQANNGERSHQVSMMRDIFPGRVSGNLPGRGQGTAHRHPSRPTYAEAFR